MPLGPGRSRSEPVRCLRLCRVVSFLSYSPLCAFMLCFFFCWFFCVLAGEKKSILDTIWSRFLCRSLRNFCFFLTLVKFAPWSNVAESLKSHQLK